MRGSGADGSEMLEMLERLLLRARLLLRLLPILNLPSHELFLELVPDDDVSAVGVWGGEGVDGAVCTLRSSAPKPLAVLVWVSFAASSGGGGGEAGVVGFVEGVAGGRRVVVCVLAASSREVEETVELESPLDREPKELVSGLLKYKVGMLYTLGGYLERVDFGDPVNVFIGDSAVGGFQGLCFHCCAELSWS